MYIVIGLKWMGSTESIHFNTFHVFLKCLQLLERVTYGCKITTPSGYIEELIRYLVTHMWVRSGNSYIVHVHVVMTLSIYYVLYGWLCKWARWTESCTVIGYPSEQDSSILSCKKVVFFFFHTVCIINPLLTNIWVLYLSRQTFGFFICPLLINFWEAFYQCGLG